MAASKRSNYKMQWGAKFLDFAWQYKFRIANYPSALEDAGQIIGGSFSVRKIPVSQYNDFLPAMEKASTGGAHDGEDAEDDDFMAIVPWDDGSSSASLSERICSLTS